MNPQDTASLETEHPDPEPFEAQPTMEEVSHSIWRLTEDVLELLRAQATSQVRREKSKDVLWIDDITRAQGNTVIAVKQLSETSPEGITLKTLAETVGVTPAAASVMVDLLVKKKMLKRTRSKSDRRSVLIRLNPDTARLFDICDRSLGESVMCLVDQLGPEVLRDWQRILTVASTTLRQMIGTGASLGWELDDLPPAAAGDSPLQAEDGTAPQAEENTDLTS